MFVVYLDSIVIMVNTKGLLPGMVSLTIASKDLVDIVGLRKVTAAALNLGFQSPIDESMSS